MAKSTKQLARELGLLRKRPLSVSSPNCGKKKQKNGQQFSHLIIIDFESTCWDNDKLRPQEIIEFPAVLLNTATGEVEDEFHHYLQPSEEPFLSRFCQELTGISQDTVDNGIPLSMCLRKFTRWIQKLKDSKGIVCVDDTSCVSTDTNQKLAALVTWSDWDLGVCLFYEARRKQITRPKFLNCWIDLRATYRKYYQRRPEGLNGALKELGIEFDGREHSGLDDARNTARLACRMMRDGCVMAITKTLKMDKQGGFQSVSIAPRSQAIGINCLPGQNPASNVKRRVLPFKIAEDKIISNISCISDTNKSNQPMLTEKNINIVNNGVNQSTFTSLKTKNMSDEDLASPDRASQLNIKISCVTKNSPFKTRLPVPVKSPPKSKGLATSTGRGCQAEPQTLNTPIKRPVGLSRIPVSVATCVATWANQSVTSNSSCNENKSPLFIGNPSNSTQDSKMDNNKVINYQKDKLIISDMLHTNMNTCSKGSFNAHKDTLPLSSLVKTGGQPCIDETYKSLGKPTTGDQRVQSFEPPSKSGSHRVIETTPRSVYSKNNVFNKLKETSPIVETFKMPQSKERNSTGSSRTSSCSIMRVTPPLCLCGRRSRRRQVQNCGPNMGRLFFTCTLSRPGSAPSSGGRTSGCAFFQWEVPAAQQSNRSLHVRSPPTPTGSNLSALQPRGLLR